MVKNIKTSVLKIACIFNTHTYCMTIENAHLTTSVNKHLYSIQVCIIVFESGEGVNG